MKTAAEIMIRDVKTIPDEATLREAAEILTVHQISGAPVVDSAGTLVGIISESDLLSDTKKRAALPRVAAFGLFMAPEESLMRIYHDGATLLVREIMTKNVVTATEAATIKELSNVMIDKRINRLPILDSEGRLIGIVTREDVLRATFDL